MELTVVMRLRIAAAMAVGIAIMAFFAFPLIAPATPMDAITFYDSSITPVPAILYVIIAFVAGIIAHLVSYPHGIHLAPLAVPVGLAAATFRSGTMMSLLQQNNELTKKVAIYSSLQWESIFWLTVVAAGFGGVLAAAKFIKSSTVPVIAQHKHKASENKYLSNSIAVVATIVIALFLIGILAQDVKISDTQLTSVNGQPSRSQIAFAVIVAFGVAAFVAKYYLNVHFMVTTASAVILTIYCTRAYANPEFIKYMTANYPPAFFSRYVCAILPIQMICFAAIGSICGFWIAIKTAHSRQIAHNNGPKPAESAA